LDPISLFIIKKRGLVSFIENEKQLEVLQGKWYPAGKLKASFFIVPDGLKGCQQDTHRAHC